MQILHAEQIWIGPSWGQILLGIMAIIGVLGIFIYLAYTKDLLYFVIGLLLCIPISFILMASTPSDEWKYKIVFDDVGIYNKYFYDYNIIAIEDKVFTLVGEEFVELK